MTPYRVPVPAGWGVWPHASGWGDREWGAWLSAQGWSAAKVAAYLSLRAALAIRVRQVQTGEESVFYAPTPMGVLFHLDPRPNLLFGGAAGGAKSYTARHDAYLRLMALPGCRLLLLRRTFTELMDNHLDEAAREVERLRQAGLPFRFLKDERRVVYDHGKGKDPSWLRFGHCENEGDEEHYLSSAYEVVYVDEAATFTKKQVLTIQERLRSAIPGATALLRCTSNPGGAHTLWLKAWFMDHTVTAEENDAYDPAEWGFIQSKLYHNPYYMDPDGTWGTYVKRLKGQGTERARQMLEGDWDVIEGQFFREWRRDAHVVDLGPIGPEVARFRCLDWGYNNRFAVYWVAALPDGRLYVEHEWSDRQIIAADVAQGITAQTTALYGRAGGVFDVRYTAADPSMFLKTGQIGESIAETFARHRVPLKKGNNDRVIGWQRMRHWLQRAPDGLPWLVVHPSCGYLIRTLPALVSDPDKPEDVDTRGDDHGADALRYGLMSRPAPSMVDSRRPTPPVGSIGHLIAAETSRRRGLVGEAHVRR